MRKGLLKRRSNARWHWIGRPGKGYFSRGKFGKLGIAALLWAVTPRKLKLIAAGFVAAAMLVVLGSLAAIVLLAMQLG